MNTKTHHKERSRVPRETIKTWLEMLALAQKVQNISPALPQGGVSRSHFYEIKEAFWRSPLQFSAAASQSAPAYTVSGHISVPPE